ncbi:MAG: hypothetical protein Q9222_005026 [Ikaeria aurantiellina]
MSRVGRFLAAKFHLDSLSTKSSIRAIRNALVNLSNTLTELYDETLERIESQNTDDRKLAKKALQWIAFTYRPLRPYVLQQALSIEPNDTSIDPEAFPPIDLVLDVCAGLLKVDEEDQVVRLVHYTAQEYFDALLGTRFVEAHASIAKDCMAFLSVAQLPLGGKTDANDFVLYASTFWASHANAAQEATLDTQMEMLSADNFRMIPTTISQYDDLVGFGYEYYPVIESCHGAALAAFYGLPQALHDLLPTLQELNAVVHEARSLLHLAAYNDQESIVRLLLDHGADIECRTVDDDSTTPLHIALNRGSMKAATLLVSRGANPNVVDGKGWTPLSLINCEHPAPIVRLLLCAGAVVTAKDIFGFSILMRSIVLGDDVEALQLLEERFLSGSVELIKVSTAALEYAVRWGSGRMVKMMLVLGTKLNSKAEYSIESVVWEASQLENTANLGIIRNFVADFLLGE